MTHRMETRFVCDRCRKEHIEPVMNVTMTGRMSIPDWLTVWFVEATTPPLHFCPSCAKALHEWIKAGPPL